MKKLAISLSSAALSGIVAFSLAPPALAESTHAGRAGAPTTVSADAGRPVAAAYTRAQKLKRLGQLTGESQVSQTDWFNTRVKWQNGSNKYGFDWNTDGCSGVTDNPVGFHFWESCARHDFGYRNYKKLHAFSHANKKHVDKAFFADMTRQCNGQWGKTSIERKACRKVAKKYYDAVVTLGHL
ncbi:phospholipase [Streptomyces inhibens]|uniref:phospholipase n=1 Tax=Streptomyces inhibens TaxID=2293571 RepID=UPI00267EB1AA